MFPSTKPFFAHKEPEVFVLLRECWIENTLKRVCLSHSKSVHSVENLYRLSPRMSTVQGTIKAKPYCGSMKYDLISQCSCASTKAFVPSCLYWEVQIHNWYFCYLYIWHYDYNFQNKEKWKMRGKCLNSFFM